MRGRWWQFLSSIKIGVKKIITIIIILLGWSITELEAQDLLHLDTVVVQSGPLTLKGLLWRPVGSGPFPAIIYCHGGYKDAETIHDIVLGPIFAKQGYAFLFLFRRGIGLSKGQGINATDLMDKAFQEKGQDERNKVQLQELETTQLEDVSAGLAFIQARKDIDKNRIAVAGVSIGASLALLLAENHLNLKAVILLAPIGYSWDRSPQLRLRLMTAAKNISAPVMIVQAANDYSLNPTHMLDSVMNENNKAHLIKIYSSFGNSQTEGHHFIFLSTQTWEADVFTFLSKNL
jgi:dienelactone hydrolase